MHFSNRIQNLTGSVARHILSRSQNSNLISFAGGLPSPEFWQNLELPQVTSKTYQYGPSEGDANLRSLFTQRLQPLGVPATPENTIVTSGSQQGLDLVSKLFIDHNTPIAIEAPTYLAALQCFQLYQAKIHSLPIHEHGIDLEQLDSLLRDKRPSFIYLNPTFQNPSGFCYTLEQRKAIASILDQYDTILIEDDPYREITFDAPAPPPITSFLKSTSWIYLTSVSKTLLPGLRIGCLACSQTLYPHLLKLKQATDLHTSRITQSIAYQLLSDPATLEPRLKAGLKLYQAKRNSLHAALKTSFASLGQWTVPQGGMFIWLKLNRRIDLDTALERALSTGVAFMPGDTFFASPKNSGRFIRLNFTLPIIEEIQQGIPLIRDALTC